MSHIEDITPVTDKMTGEVSYFEVSKQYLLSRLETLVAVDDGGMVEHDELKNRINNSKVIEYYPTDEQLGMDTYNIYSKDILHKVTQVIDLQREKEG